MMDGLLIAYHNTDQIFGFQYVTLKTIGDILYKNSETGDSVFCQSIIAFGKVLDYITELYKEARTTRLTMKLSKDGSNLTVFSENLDEIASNIPNTVYQMSIKCKSEYMKTLDAPYSVEMYIKKYAFSDYQEYKQARNAIENYKSFKKQGNADFVRNIMNSIKYNNTCPSET